MANVAVLSYSLPNPFSRANNVSNVWQFYLNLPATPSLSSFSSRIADYIDNLKAQPTLPIKSSAITFKTISSSSREAEIPCKVRTPMESAIS